MHPAKRRRETLVNEEPQPADGRLLPFEVGAQDLEKEELGILPDSEGRSETRPGRFLEFIDSPRGKTADAYTLGVEYMEKIGILSAMLGANLLRAKIPCLRRSRQT